MLPPAYACEVTKDAGAYSGGKITTRVLATSQAVSPKLALRWARGQAQRIANTLDPGCSDTWKPQRGHYFDVPAATCPAQLRAWCEDSRAQQTAREQLDRGSPATLVVSDSADRYTLSIWPVPAPTVETANPLPGDHGQSTSPRPGRKSHRKARRTSGWLPRFVTRAGRLNHRDAGGKLPRRSKPDLIAARVKLVAARADVTARFHGGESIASIARDFGYVGEKWLAAQLDEWGERPRAANAE